MTTLNTIIEEEVDAYKNDYAQAITDVGGFGLAKHIERFLTTAMQRAYEAGEKKGQEEEGESIEAIFKKYVPPHAMDLEDSVWLKRLLNKAFGHENIH